MEVSEQSLGSIIGQLQSTEITQIHEGLARIDELLYELCSRADPNRGTNMTRRSHRHSSSIASSASNTSGSDLESPNVSNGPSGTIATNTSRTSNGTRKWKVPGRQHRVFGEFIQLQDKFQYNLASSLVELLKEPEVPAETIALILKDLQGCLLLHPGSRDLFQRASNLKALLRLLTPDTDTIVLVNCVPTLVSCLVRNVKALRLFEKLNGPEIACNLLKAGAETMDEDIENGWKEVQVKVLEFLFFYLIPESSQARHVDGVERRSLESKREVLNRYLNREVTKSLVQELVVSRPFGKMEIDW